MDEIFNQSISSKKPSNKIKKKKVKYMNITIFLVIIHCVSFLIQKIMEFQYNDSDSDSYRRILTKDIFLVSEDIIITIFIIKFLYKFNNNLIIIFSILYFIIGEMMILYFILNIFYLQSEKHIEWIVIYIINIILFFIEGYLLFSCSEIIEKEKELINREKYGYKNNEEMVYKSLTIKTIIDR